ncbi:hypothetical protein Q3G72_016009 [Acer saccharum]|nr:hypothetical protein Q3G72_016009 [Acer saccharum]
MECTDHMFYDELIVCVICIHMITLGSPCKRHEVFVRVGRTWIAKQEVLSRVGRTWIGKQEDMARIGKVRIVMHERLPRGMSALDRELAYILSLDALIRLKNVRGAREGLAWPKAMPWPPRVEAMCHTARAPL